MPVSCSPAASVKYPIDPRRSTVGARVIDACWLAPASIASIRRAVVNESTPGRMMPAALPSSMMRAALSVRRLRERVAHQAAAV
jgi:hypothetical protein